MFLPFKLMAASMRSAWFFDEERKREPVGVGGGGKTACCPFSGELDCCRLDETGDRRSTLEKTMPGDTVVAALVGVRPREESVPGDIVSEGDVTLLSLCDSSGLCGEYGGGGDATGSIGCKVSFCKYKRKDCIYHRVLMVWEQSL